MLLAGLALAEERGCDRPHTPLELWLATEGAEFSAVRSEATVTAGGGSGLFAARHIEEGEVMLSVPAALQITEDTIRNLSAFGPLLEADDEVRRAVTPGEPTALILALDYERHTGRSPWQPYIDSLPTPTSPLLWSDAELAELQCSPLAAMARRHRAFFERLHARLYPHLFEVYPAMYSPAVHTLDSLLWAALTVYQRAFDLGPHDATEPVWGLVPYMDTSNHATGTENGYAVDSDVFDLTCTAALAPGDEVRPQQRPCPASRRPTPRGRFSSRTATPRRHITGSCTTASCPRTAASATTSQ